MRFSLMLFALALLLRVGGGQGGVKWLRKLANRCLRALASRAWACGACGGTAFCPHTYSHGIGCKVPVSSWCIGKFVDPARVSFEVSVKQDKRPATHSLEMLFSTRKVAKSKKLGFILFEVKGDAFYLRGMSVNDEWRGKGLAVSFLATWLSVCGALGVAPRTERMDKPLVSLVLQKFGFRPANMSHEVLVGREGEGVGGAGVVLWSRNPKQLQSLVKKEREPFDSSLIQHQGRAQPVRMAEEEPDGSTVVYINTAYQAPSDPAEWKSAAAARTRGKLALDTMCNACFSRTGTRSLR